MITFETILILSRQVATVNMTSLPSKELIASIEAFLDAHYEFRNKNKYYGLLRKIKGYFDRFELEEREKQELSKHERQLEIEKEVFDEFKF